MNDNAVIHSFIQIIRITQVSLNAWKDLKNPILGRLRMGSGLSWVQLAFIKNLLSLTCCVLAASSKHVVLRLELLEVGG